MSWLVRLILGLYPPWWRKRYGKESQELTAELLADPGGKKLRTLGSLFFGATTAWFQSKPKAHYLQPVSAGGERILPLPFIEPKLSKGVVASIVVASLAILAAGSLVLLGNANLACGGQCTSPYTLEVDFKVPTYQDYKHWTSQAYSALQADSALLHNCTRHNQEVVSVSPVELATNNSGTIESIIQTVDFAGPKVKPMTACLDASPLVWHIGYPD